MKERKLSLSMLMLVMLLVFSACGGGSNESNSSQTNSTENAENQTNDYKNNGGEVSTNESGEKILRTNNKSEPASLDPALAKGTHESWILQHTFTGLMGYNEDGELVPAVAESYDESDDGLTYTFHLRDDVKWSNGDPVTAEDFEYAWKRVIDPELASDYAYQISDYVKGAEEYLNGEGSVDDVAIKAIDEKTLEVTLKKPAPYFLGLTAFYTLYPVNKNVVEANSDWAKDPSNGQYISNGAFKLVSWDHNQKISLRKNPEWYRADEVKLDGIDFDIIEEQNTQYTKYQGGEYDFIVNPPTAVVDKLTKENDPELYIGGDVGTYYYQFNNKEKPFNNAKVRNALSMAIDRKAIVENITKGGQVPAEGLVPYGFLDENGKEFRDRNGNLVKEDKEAAKSLLEEGLAEEGMKLEDLNGTVILFNTDEAHKNIAQAIQQMWKQAFGVDFQLENAEFKVVLDRRKSGDYKIARAGWIGDYLDPNTMLDIMMTENGNNDAFYSNPEFDNLMKEAGESSDNEFRFEKMAEAEKIVMEDMGVTPIYFYTQPYLQKSYVTGVYKNNMNYPTLTFADIEQSNN
ncbi:peptide ABC transporter substrate-binding protein [Anaerococcus martiniensis]|uniref:peptide ABC transporter substrate-binding protein n=1 Tax=Anaerococcus sp. WGS1579 TaxID=3366809 RepID=UPI00372D01AD